MSYLSIQPISFATNPVPYHQLANGSPKSILVPRVLPNSSPIMNLSSLPDMLDQDVLVATVVSD
jgi:hypothetical protein